MKREEMVKDISDELYVDIYSKRAFIQGVEWADHTPMQCLVCEASSRDYNKMKSALNKIGILQMGELDYTKDFFEQTKIIVRETLENLEVK